MKNQDIGKRRSDRPSGRQASEQPEHAGNAEPATETLHQGQGPDLISQDPHIQRRNKGVQQLSDDPRSQGRTVHQQPIDLKVDKTHSNRGDGK
jgi:hypothetical protein